jgi:hypothetical protein
MEFIKIFIVISSLFSSVAFGGTLHKLQTQDRAYSATLSELTSRVEATFSKRAEVVCGRGNVKRLFGFNSEIEGDFEVGGSDSVLSLNYPLIKASITAECN